jgi:hypothetical protein
MNYLWMKMACASNAAITCHARHLFKLNNPQPIDHAQDARATPI